MKPLSDALVGFHSDDLIGLVSGLAMELEGRLVPGTADHNELIDAELASEVGEALGLRRIDLLIEAVQGALEERHWEIEDAMTAWEIGACHCTSWLEAMFAAADRVAANVKLALAA